jgi:nitrite reductase/ring-hydroxylating ferredoxin subunit
MEWIKVLDRGTLGEGARQVVEVRDHRILLLKHEGRLYAVLNSCPHMGVSLRKGTVTEDQTIVCPLHHSAFSLETGEVKAWSPWPPVVGDLLGKVKPEQPLRTFPVKVEQDAIWIGLESGSDTSR